MQNKMEGEIDENALLDYAVFHASPTQNSYEAFACLKGKKEAMAFGPLNQLALYLSEANECQANQSNTSFKLQLVENQKGFSCFTKATLSRFLHIVNMPEALKNINAIVGEMSQLEETKNFHVSLYAKGQDKSACRTTAFTDISSLKEVGVNQQIKVEPASSDATKNELLRALDLRLMTLDDELVTLFNRAAGATCSIQQISDLSAFAEQFGTIDLRNLFLKVLARRPKNQPADPSVQQPLSLQDLRNNCGNPTRDILQPSPQTVVKPVKNVVSPAQIAQAERQCSSESEESCQSSDEDQSRSERSRSLVRSATPKRSASPMRRIQIGRSGSRRSTSLTIKSLSYFPVRERTTSIRDADGSNSGDEEPDRPPKKPENPVRRMSVQDAISLFESKQKDQNLDIQKRKASGEVSTSTTAKSVLRRWSAGMGDSFSHSTHENASDAASQDTLEENKSAEVKVDSSNIDESPQVAQSSEVEDCILSPMGNPVEPVTSKVEEVNDRTTTAEWSQQKEAELNQMMMKMMEIKPGKQRGANCGNGVQQDIPSERRAGLYGQYREKRDEKLLAENAGKRAVKEVQFKVMKEALEQSRAEMVSKSVSSTGRRDLPNHSQKPRRNSSPPVLQKKEVSKPAGMRKASSKTSLLPATRNSWSAGPLPRTSGTPTSKTPSGPVLTDSTPNRRKPLTAPLATQPSPRAERLPQTKVKKGTPPDAKPNLKLQEEKSQRSVTRSSKSAKTKSPATPGDDSVTLPAKPSFYNKVTKKSSVVPLESKPFLKKGTGIAPRGTPMATKPKVSRPDDSSKNNRNLTQSRDNESSAVMTVSNPKVHEVEYVQPADADASLEAPLENDVSCNQMDDWDQVRDDLDNVFKNAVELPVPEIQAEEDTGITSAAWVEVEHEEGSASCDSGLPGLSISPELASAASLSSPRVRHSLSQMLQADNDEPEIIEWGNAENPPSLVYQKDAPKGFKRLLKFARKSKGEANVTGWASPSVYSDGEDDTEESKAATKSSSDAVWRKAALQAKGSEPPKFMFSGSSDGGNSSKTSMDHGGMNECMPVQSSGGTATILDRLREGQNLTSATSTKGATNQVGQSFDKVQSSKSWWK